MKLMIQMLYYLLNLMSFLFLYIYTLNANPINYNNDAVTNVAIKVPKTAYITILPKF